MKAIILAAGRGSRMKEQTADRPKCLIELWDQTLLEMNLAALEQAGFEQKDIGIITGYRADKIPSQGLKQWHNARWQETNMFYTLTMAEEWLTSEPCIVCYSDIVYHPKAITALKEAAHDLAITYYTDFRQLWELRFDDPLSDVESFKIDSEGKIIEIGQQVTLMEDVQGQFMGLIRFTPASWQIVKQAILQPMPKTIEQLDMTTLLSHLITQGYAIYGLPIDDLWLECDNAHDLTLYEQHYTPEAFPQRKVKP